MSSLMLKDFLNVLPGCYANMFFVFTAMKPHRTLRSMLVHPKDKLLLHQKSKAIYKYLVLIALNLTLVRPDDLLAPEP